MAETEFEIPKQAVADRVDQHGSISPCIVIVDNDGAAAAQIKNAIEFIDARDVVIASPDKLAGTVKKHRIAVLFQSRSLSAAHAATAAEVYATLQDDVPLVLYGKARARCAATPKRAFVTCIENPLLIDELGATLRQLEFIHDGPDPAPTSSGKRPRLIGDSADMRMIRTLIERVAPSRATVLVTGESGTGKELVARQIHEQSGVAGDFVAINCGAIPDHLLESELFGHVKGAFTGAQATRAGRIEQAHGGTLFLDEIGDMPTAMQVKLLRVLQERVVERVGSTSGKAVDIRVIAATHRDLQERIAEGAFREDLFYRLSVFPIDISPLRERPEDIEPLVYTLMSRVQKNYGIRVGFSAAAMQALSCYPWPGNVRELANLVERLAVCFPERKISVDDVNIALGNQRVFDAEIGQPRVERDPAMNLPEEGIDLKRHISRIERDMIASALLEADGVVQRAAQRLGIGRTTLVEKIRRHELRT